MNPPEFCFRSGLRLSGFALLALALSCTLSRPAAAQTIYQTETGEKLLFKSTGAARIAEKVRANAPGVMVEIFVKAGDMVKKGDILGHTELDATKLQLDLAKRALDSKANVDAAEGQAEAWTVTREETEDQVEKRKAEKTRLTWAVAMEKMYRANYEVQLETENVQQIQYDYWKDQYDKRFLKAPVDGMVSEIVVEVGKNVNIATHVFTISDENTFSIPVTIPAPLAAAISPSDKLPVRSSDGKSVTRALVDSIIDDPRAAGEKIVRLLVQATDFPAALRPNLKGMKFDVLLPQAVNELNQ
ncbi:MAG: HlyD family efflux transporter periplasmic adaptor subunit [Luteolibacter sp.]